jgi:hypothetical protein
MKDFLVNNFEKVLLTTLLLVLAACSVLQILSMDKKKIEVLQADNIGTFVKETKIPSIADTKISLVEDRLQPYDSQGYIYCRKSDCNFLILSTESKCPWCNTDTKPPRERKKGGDIDMDGISDELEIKYGLNKDDPKDATLDKDEDGFSNLDEVTLEHSPNDAEDHPSVINRTRYRGAKPDPYPLKIATIDTGKFRIGDDPSDLKKGSWDIHVDVIVNKRKRSRYFKINDKDSDLKFTIADVGIENDKPFVLVKMADEEEPIKFFESKAFKIKSIAYYFFNELDKKYYQAEMGKEFFLPDLKGNKEKYKFIKFDATKKEATIIDYQTSENDVKVGLEAKLKEPGAVNEDLDPEGLEGFEERLRVPEL